jgi:aerobic carbon-monoxide dehydrogenase small subunit
MATRRISVSVNGKQYEREVEPRDLLVYFLRENLGLTGTNVGCDTSSCGACTVLINGESVKACTVLAVQADGDEITTIEGLGANGDMHPMQKAFGAQHALQCGFCTPGMIMASVSLVEHGAGMSEDEIRLGLEGNLCRCSGGHARRRSARRARAQ